MPAGRGAPRGPSSGDSSRGVTPRPSPWLRVMSVSGLVMTLLYIVLSLFPIIKVENAALFAFKIASLIVVMNLVGVGILLAARRRAQSPASMEI